MVLSKGNEERFHRIKVELKEKEMKRLKYEYFGSEFSVYLEQCGDLDESKVG